MNQIIRKKAKTAQTTRSALDWLVATCENTHPQVLHVPGRFGIFHAAGNHCYSADWRLAGPIIEREGIDLYHVERAGPVWEAEIQTAPKQRVKGRGPTPLVAAMWQVS